MMNEFHSRASICSLVDAISSHSLLADAVVNVRKTSMGGQCWATVKSSRHLRSIARLAAENRQSIFKLMDAGKKTHSFLSNKIS